MPCAMPDMDMDRSFSSNAKRGSKFSKISTLKSSHTKTTESVGSLVRVVFFAGEHYVILCRMFYEMYLE